MSAVEIVRTIEQLSALSDGWRALAPWSGSPLVDYDWFLSCAEVFHRDGTLRVVVVRSAGGIDAIAPLAVDMTPSGPHLTIPGASRLHEPGGWLFTSDAALVTLADAVTRLRMPLLLHRIPAGSPLCDALPKLNRHRALTVVREAAPSFAVAVGRSWDEYYDRLSSRITRNLPRVRRKAERALGPMKLQQVAPSPGHVDALLDTLVKIEGSGWKGRRGSSLAGRPELHEFFRRYCRRAAAAGTLRVATLHFGSDIGAMELAVESRNRWWQLKIGYNDGLAAYYPGLHLTEAAIRSAFERGLDAYEFLGSAEAWEEAWRPETREYRTVVAYPLSLGGVVGACRDIAGVLLRRSTRSVRTPVHEVRA
jgi:CelD/BcsL family acetyltransferase involved in cellulose biosynthesis